VYEAFLRRAFGHAMLRDTIVRNPVTLKPSGTNASAGTLLRSSSCIRAASSELSARLRTSSVNPQAALTLPRLETPLIGRERGK
jgi:hypothetical protein